MQLSAFADLQAGIWDVAVDGRWLGDGPGEQPIVEFPAFEPTAVGSARLVAVWLENGETFSLSALRPATAKGHDRDEIAVQLPASQGQLEVFDPRLSTEYSSAGTPQRFGIELWLGENADADQHPLRLAGEGDGAPLSDGSLRVYPMHSHGAGVPGRGLYLLVQQ